MPYIFTIGILCYISFKYNGIDGLNNTVTNLFTSCKFVLKWINEIVFQLNDESILTFLFQHKITFFAVGILFVIFNVNKSKFGKFFGKVAYWIIGTLVAFGLDYISNLIFN